MLAILEVTDRLERLHGSTVNKVSGRQPQGLHRGKPSLAVSDNIRNVFQAYGNTYQRIGDTTLSLLIIG